MVEERWESEGARQQHQWERGAEITPEAFPKTLHWWEPENKVTEGPNFLVNFFSCLEGTCRVCQ